MPAPSLASIFVAAPKPVESDDCGEGRRGDECADGGSGG